MSSIKDGNWQQRGCGKCDREERGIFPDLFLVMARPSYITNYLMYSIVLGWQAIFGLMGVPWDMIISIQLIGMIRAPLELRMLGERGCPLYTGMKDYRSGSLQIVYIVGS
jgi:hypothetical protein